MIHFITEPFETFSQIERAVGYCIACGFSPVHITPLENSLQLSVYVDDTTCTVSYTRLSDDSNILSPKHFYIIIDMIKGGAMHDDVNKKIKNFSKKEDTKNILQDYPVLSQGFIVVDEDNNIISPAIYSELMEGFRNFRKVCKFRVIKILFDASHLFTQK